MRLEAIAALLGHQKMEMTLIYARIANRVVADEYATVSAKIDALYGQPPALPADYETTGLAGCAAKPTPGCSATEYAPARRARLPHGIRQQLRQSDREPASQRRDHLRRARLRPARRHRSATAVPVRRCSLRTPLWPFESWGRFLPEHATAVSLLDRLLHHCHVVITDGDSYRMKQARARGGTQTKPQLNQPEEWDFYWPPPETSIWPLTNPGPSPGFPYQRHHRRTVQQVFGV
jgi:IstB-like ATP binding protein